MRTLILAFSMLTVAVAAYGQTTIRTGKLSTDKHDLKCEKYQHIEPGRNASTQCFTDSDAKIPNNFGPYCAPGSLPDHCVDDLHPVTEREWQELQARLAKAEANRDAGLKAAQIASECLHDLGVCTDRMELAHKMVQNMQDSINSLKAKP